MKHRKLWLAAAAVTSVGYAVRRSSEEGILDAEAVQRLYDRLAPIYDVVAWIFRPLGARRLQDRAVDLLDLRPGDTVVDLGCGTGVNLPILAQAVGERGQVVGVDLSVKMLDHARRRADRLHLFQVSFIQDDIRSVRLPPGTRAVVATASLEMIAEQDELISDLAAQLRSTGGRLAVGGFRRPPGWPEWAVGLGRASLAVFGVNRAYENIQPWLSIRDHMDEIAVDSAAGGALYLVVAQPRPLPHRTADETSPRM